MCVAGTDTAHGGEAGNGLSVAWTRPGFAGGSRMRGLAEFSSAFSEAEYALENLDKCVR